MKKNKAPSFISLLFACTLIGSACSNSQVNVPEDNPPQSHDEGEGDEGTPLTHTHHFLDSWESDASYHWHKCESCDEISSKAAHTFGSWVVDLEPTYTLKGHQYRLCTICDYKEEQDLDIIPHVHQGTTPVEENYIQPTCTKSGSYDEVLYCELCGEEIYREHHSIAPTGHIHTATRHDNEVAPGCTSEGSYTLVTYCEDDGYVISSEEKTIPALGHDYELIGSDPATYESDGVNHLKCRRCGNLKDEKGEDRLVHTFSDEYLYDENGHWHPCLDEGYEDAILNKEEHTMHIADYISPTYTEGGYDVYECGYCEYSYTVPNDLPPREHEYSFEYSYDETHHWYQCVDEGYEELYTGKAEHDFDVVEVSPTYSKDGSRVSTCSECGYSFEEILPKKSHTYDLEHWSVDLINGTHYHACVDAGYEESLKIDVDTHDYIYDETNNKYYCSVCNHEVEVNNDAFEFVFDEDHYVINQINCSYETVFIPEKYNGFDVTVIQATYVTYSDSLREIYIPSTITSIREHFLENCRYIERITLPSIWGEEAYPLGKLFKQGDYLIGGLRTINQHAGGLYYQSVKYTVSIPTSVKNVTLRGSTVPAGFLSEFYVDYAFTPDATRIGKYAFRNATVKMIECPSMEYIEIGAFTGVYGLEEVHLPSSLISIEEDTSLADLGLNESRTFSTIYDAFFRILYDGTPEMWGDIQRYHFTGFGKVLFKGLGDYSYNGLSFGELTSLHLNRDPLAYENCYAFMTDLKEVTTENVTRFKTGMFNNAVSLTSITMDESLLSIGEKALRNAQSLRTLCIPNSVTYIAKASLYGLSDLRHLEVPFLGTDVENVTPSYESHFSMIFGDSEFTNSYELSGTYYRESDGENIVCKYYVPKYLSEVVVTGDTPAVRFVTSGVKDRISFTFLGSITEVQPKSLCDLDMESITIAEGVSVIATSSFSSCKSLTTIYLPSTITEIRGEPFVYCYALTDIYYNGDISDWMAIGKVPYEGMWKQRTSQNVVIHCNDGDLPIADSN